MLFKAVFKLLPIMDLALDCGHVEHFMTTHLRIWAPHLSKLKILRIRFEQSWDNEDPPVSDIQLNIDQMFSTNNLH